MVKLSKWYQKNWLLFVDIYGFYLESLSSLFAEIKIIFVLNFCDLISGSIPLGLVH